jgi:hypothetical protein
MTYLATLDTVVPFLRIPTPVASLSATDTANLQMIIDAAAALIESHTGKVETAQYVEEHDGGDVSIYLRRPPVLRVVSIVEVIGLERYTLTQQPVGYSTDNFGYSIDNYNYGRIVRRSAGSQPLPFYKNAGNIEVTYVAGMGDCPPNLTLATLELIKHLWFSSQQGSRPVFGDPSAGAMVTSSGPGYALPNRVVELLGDKRRPIVIA